ncbi:MAG: serine/threonine-protein kinase RIO2 [Nitrososphaerales archaeon]
MSSAEVAAKVVKSLEQEEFNVLKALASSLKDHESLTTEQIASRARMHIDKANFSVGKLNQMELVFRNRRGFSLVMAGLDALALKFLADKDIVIGMGKAIGVGKESDVFETLTPDHKYTAIKFFRIGRTSFREVKRKRSFNMKLHHWLLVNIDAAKKEFNALKILHKTGVKVPAPYALAKHAIVMERVDGPRLIQCDTLDLPKKVLEIILSNVRLAYNAGMISADLSEYNVLYDGKDVWIIDWPQSVRKKHPNAQLLLKRDIENLLKFFRRKYGLKYPLNDVLRYVTR